MSNIHNQFNQYSDEQLVQLAADTQKMAHDAPKNCRRSKSRPHRSRHAAEWRAICDEIHRRGIPLGKGWTIIPSPLPPDPVGEGGFIPGPWRFDREREAHARLTEAASDMLDALIKLSNEVLGTLPLMETLARREFGNTNYNILIQRAEEARALITKVQGQTP